MIKRLAAAPDDVCLFAGCACVVIGVAQVSGPAAWIVAGVELIGLGILIGRKMADAAVENSVQQ